jgi:hypothetical protein
MDCSLWLSTFSSTAITQKILEDPFEINKLLRQHLTQYVCCSPNGRLLQFHAGVFTGTSLLAFQVVLMSFEFYQ